MDDMLIYDKEYILYGQRHYCVCGSIRHTAKEHEVVATEALKEL